jgi:hypothetical protein
LSEVLPCKVEEIGSVAVRAGGGGSFIRGRFSIQNLRLNTASFPQGKSAIKQGIAA